jgi:hypothetical protein
MTVKADAWTFENELRFISNLGTHTDLVKRQLYTRQQLLEGYSAGLAQRIVGFTPQQRCGLRERIEIELLTERRLP